MICLRWLDKGIFKIFQKPKRGGLDMTVLAICALIVLLAALIVLYYLESEDQDD